jgi:RNA polymerase sigma-70 factor (ECF subfamily)
MQFLDDKDQEIERLVVASQKGSSDAFGKIYDLFINPIYRYMFFRVGSADAEDLTELVFLKTWEHIKRYQSGRNKFSSWIFRIAHNVVIDHYRSNKHESELEEHFQDFRKEANTPTMAHERFNHELLGSAMSKLRGPYRQILILKYINDLSN